MRALHRLKSCHSHGALTFPAAETSDLGTHSAGPFFFYVSHENISKEVFKNLA